MGLVGSARPAQGATWAALGRGWVVGRWGWGTMGTASGRGSAEAGSRGACPNRPPRPRFLLIGSYVAGLRLSRRKNKNLMRPGARDSAAPGRQALRDRFSTFSL